MFRSSDIPYPLSLSTVIDHKSLYRQLLATAHAPLVLLHCCSSKSSSTGGAASVGLVFDPFVETVLMELVATEKNSHCRPTFKQLQAEAALITLLSGVELGLILDIPEDSHLLEPFEFGSVGKPRKRIGRFDPILHVPVVNKNTSDHITHNNDNDGSHQQQGQRKHDVEKYGGGNFDLLSLYIFHENCWQIIHLV